MRMFFLIFLFLTNIFLLQSQSIEISGNGIVILSDGSNSPNEADNTYYPDTQISGVRTHIFSISNLSTRDDIRIERITINSLEFVSNNKKINLKKNQTKTFEIAFEPTSIGLKNAIVEIKYKIKKKKFISSFNIEGNAIEESAGGNIMISQYYENGDNDYIEIINLTDVLIKNKAYYLAMYGSNDDIRNAPKKGNTIDIRSMNPKEVRLFSKFKLSGNDIVLLSTSKNKDCYKNRVDIIGTKEYMWGNAKSFTKGGCATEGSHTTYDPAYWVSLETLKVDEAANNQNIFLGAYQMGPIYWDGINWTDDALPDLSRITYINSDYDGNVGNIEACDLIINADVDFDKGGKNSLVVHQDLTINGSLTLGDQESLVMYDDNAAITGSITKKENSTYRNNEYDFTYWSAPISNGQVNTVFSGVSPGRIYYYDQSQSSSSDPSASDYWNTWVNASAEMIPGRGYAAEGVSGTNGIHSISFNGVPNNGLVNETIHFWDDADLDNDFNMIGNPYPSAIDIEKFFDANSSVIDPTIYLWTHTEAISNGDSGDYSPNDYATYNYTGGTGVGSGVGDGPIPQKNIGSAQGFFVRAIVSGKVVFNNAMRMEDANDQFFKQNHKKTKNDNFEKDRVWLNLTTNQGGFNQLLIGFVDGATDAIDPGFDAIKLNGDNNISFYSLADDKKLAIQGLGVTDDPHEISLGFDSKVGKRSFTISIGKIEGALKESEVYLIDHLNQVSHDLKRSDYSFELEHEGSFMDRFSIRFGQGAVLSSSDVIENNELVVFNREDLFTIKSSKVVKTIRLYDLLGKLILEQHPNEVSFEFNEHQARKGSVLLMQIICDDFIRVEKKLIKQ